MGVAVGLGVLVGSGTTRRGTKILEPAISLSYGPMQLARRRSGTVVPVAIAIAYRVSPDLTQCLTDHGYPFGGLHCRVGVGRGVLPDTEVGEGVGLASGVGEG